MQLSVIILNYNVRYFLEQCVLSVQKALENIDGEIIVVDNFSQDDSCQMIKKRFPDVKLIENKENFGFPKGNNIGVAEAKGEYICILNPDTVVAEDTFEKILNFIKMKTNLGIIGCKLIDGTGNFLPECKRGLPTPWVAMTKIFGLYKFFPKSSVFNKYYAQHLSENESGEVDILVGAFMVMKRELYLKVGGFDENCFMYSDDIDLSYLVKKEGFQNYYYHETTVIHYKGESTVRDEKYVKRFSEAMRFFYKKHFGGSCFFNFFMRVGAFSFSLLKVFQSKMVSTKKPEHYIFVSENERNENLLNIIGDRLNASVTEKSNTVPPNLKVEFIVDLKSISFKRAIDLMEKNVNYNYSFKFLSFNHDYLIGSNSANDIGQVINLTKID
ncbi:MULTISPECIES: glycosyltransferase family 2 protein [Flavobacterium]|uniref:Glycosyltransferase family 2 protein n=1 Tax=Flavobacterium hankyongi TaxID=1176532 RepID=A0ABP9A8J7_9FLAO|nr:glycosyltransferase family 2 protein [Flavobacterium sp. N1846]